MSIKLNNDLIIECLECEQEIVLNAENFETEEYSGILHGDVNEIIHENGLIFQCECENEIEIQITTWEYPTGIIFSGPIYSIDGAKLVSEIDISL